VLASLVAACVLALHSPDGSDFFVLRADIIRVVRPVAGYREHVAPGTGSILYLGGPRGFAVSEAPAQIMQMVRDCEARPG
jgi:hypothetical protein